MKDGSASVSPPAPYIGGKRNLAERIIARIERTPHELYAEPFVGMGGIFLRRRQRAPVEVINDLSRDVATLFRMLQRHYEALMDMLKWQLTSRADFERLKAAAPETLTDLERAARFLYLQRAGFGGKVVGRTFGVSRTTPARFDVTKLAPLLEEVHTRLSGVVIECLPFGEFIARYDRPGALFYLDPPYWGCEEDYGAGQFAPADFGRLVELLAGIRGRFIMSLNDVGDLRGLVAAFSVERIKTTYTLPGRTGAKAAAELLVSTTAVRQKPPSLRSK